MYMYVVIHSACAHHMHYNTSVRVSMHAHKLNDINHKLNSQAQALGDT